ncbi:MAG: protein-L-isoaspartate(D-aspartate) O-methyltransferase [Pseudomonadota bacterium]|nr:protein-L-isoaspartate(D-aspartate) O-methyltransferase [Pseudomonadota bacterium]
MTGEPETFDRQHKRLMEEIEAEMRATASYTGRTSLSKRVLEAVARVPRYRFVPDGSQAAAYVNAPLSIGHGQTISQPYIVAMMTEMLDLDEDSIVLEVGTGSAYLAAILAELVKRLYTIEIVEPLARQAAEKLKSLGYENVEVRFGDGYNGWPEHAPFDAIMVTATGDEIPPPLVSQLRPGGRMILPLGRPYSFQKLVLVEKTPQGEIRQRDVLPVAFVPLRRLRDEEE